MNEVKGKFQLGIAIEKALEDVKALERPTVIALNQIVRRYAPVTMKQVREALEGQEGMQIAYLPAARGQLVLDVMEASIRAYMTEILIDRLREDVKKEGAETAKRKTKGEK